MWYHVHGVARILLIKFSLEPSSVIPHAVVRLLGVAERCPHEAGRGRGQLQGVHLGGVGQVGHVVKLGGRRVEVGHRVGGRGEAPRGGRGGGRWRPLDGGREQQAGGRP